MQSCADKLLFILVYQKTNPLQTMHALHFDLSQAQANYWIHHLLPVLQHALAAAADLFALRNRYADGFHFATAPAMYRAYETELYQFDQAYRHCCEAAATAESRNWDVLKTLREQVEAVYVRWYLTNLTLAWATFVDPAGTVTAKKRYLIGHDLPEADQNSDLRWSHDRGQPVL